MGVLFYVDHSGSENGHFGLWTVCRRNSRLDYRCGTHVSRLQPSEYTTSAGVCGVIAVIVTILTCVMSPMVLAMRVTKRQVFFKFRHAVVAKLAVSCIGAVSCVVSLVLFGIDLDARRLGENVGFHVWRSWSFYLMVLYTLLSLALCGFAAAEFVLARRLGGDPVTMSRDPEGRLAPVLTNPGARESGRVASPNANGVTVISAGRPPGLVHPRPTEVAAQRPAPVAPTPTSSYNGKPIPYDPRKSPLRSSLKKQKRKDEASNESVDSGVMIIGNPAPGSPSAARSKKSVRINTLDTAV
ncbi:hypothetical protein FJT64_005050 [Amphibalanus amphitrite]|uniref:Uncharacterized protein n=1 Tax=Amphibalanus amphitrite TaxID=1232801 RepID=A0A6A4W652_AMPAM|nr:hypothetical protein FJT64_005050 [Amphibalanus amphitrite]